jgi:hypothetical protein
MTERVLSGRARNRALLARQLLLSRADLTVPRALERVGGLQAQYAPSAYVGLWSRLDRFRRSDLTRALERRRAVQATLMRTTIHVVSVADVWGMAAGLRAARRAWWIRIHRSELEGVDMARAAAVLRAGLRGGPRRAAELKELLASSGCPPVAWSGVGFWVDLVRVPPSGTWEQRRADLYGLAERWLDGHRATRTEGLAHLLRRYLGAFGPARLEDAAGWAGIPPTELAPAARRLPLRRFRGEQGEELLDLRGRPLPDPDTPAPVRFLATWEAALLVHARRTEILPEPYRPMIFRTTAPQSFNTFLVDGGVAGTWRYDSGRIRLEPFEPLPRQVRRDLDDEARALAAFHGDVGA